MAGYRQRWRFFAEKYYLCLDALEVGTDTSSEKNHKGRKRHNHPSRLTITITIAYRRKHKNHSGTPALLHCSRNPKTTHASNPDTLHPSMLQYKDRLKQATEGRMRDRHPVSQTEMPPRHS